MTSEVAVTYTFVVEVEEDQSPSEAVEEYVHSVGDAFSSPDKVVPVVEVHEPVCSRCGKPESETEWGSLFDVGQSR